MASALQKGPKASEIAGIFDVAISFATLDRAAAALAEELAAALRQRRIRTFYFRNIEEAASVLGERLSDALPAIYRDRSLIVVLVASPSYGRTHWTRVELDAALSRPLDDDGRPRIVPISADDSRVPDLPPDIIHLGDRVDKPTDIADVINLLCQRCGKRHDWRDRLWPPALVLSAGILIVVHEGITGTPADLSTWVLAASGSALALSALARLVPWVWMTLRRRRIEGQLGIATEGRWLRTFRRSIRWSAVAWVLAALGLSTLVIAGALDARLKAQGIDLLLEEGEIPLAIDRLQQDVVPLADFREALLARILNRVGEQLANGDWQAFEPSYRRLVAATSQRSPSLEDAFWKSSGVEALWPGADIQDYVNKAHTLIDLAPDLADRLFQTAIARQLEWLMSGNEFFYGGPRPWFVYRELSLAAGRSAWMQDAMKRGYDNNAGLSARIAVHLAAANQKDGVAKMLEFAAAEKIDGSLLDELETTRLPPGLAADTEAELVRYWKAIHKSWGASPEGFALARALAGLRTAGAEAFLIKRADQAKDSQELAHAVAGVHSLLAQGVGDSDRLSAIVVEAEQHEDDLVRLAAQHDIGLGSRCRRNIGRVWRSGLEELLEKAEEFRSTPDIESIVLNRLNYYWHACGDDADQVLMQRVRTSYGIAVPTEPSDRFEDVRADYEALGPPPGSADGALEHVRLLRAMGRTGDPAATRYLEEVFDRLAHGNMRIAAIESLLGLTGRLGATGVSELRKLANMSSSRYRSEVVDMVLRNSDALDTLPAEERQELVATLSQINLTGDANERARVLDVLALVDEDLVRRRALAMAFSSRSDDQIEGIERLWQSWQRAKSLVGTVDQQLPPA